MGEALGAGGFPFPTVYKESKERVSKLVQRGVLDLVDISRWNIADEFMAFILERKLLPFADRTYPNPRRKNEVPIWFLVSCQLLLRALGEVSYQALTPLLSAGPVLTRVGLNVLAPIGFNDKNRYPRATPVHQDAVRKFFKDTDPHAMRRWFNIALQRWFKQQRMFDEANGTYILDQTHVVVPDNPNYEDAVRMPVDEHGQRYAGFNDLTEEQKKSIPYHACYTLSTLLHLNFRKQTSHVAGYEWGPGNEDELPQARILIDRFFTDNGPGAIKLLIADRGYISGEFITYLKRIYQVDVLIPLKRSMEQFRDAVAIATMPGTKWTVVQKRGDYRKDLTRELKATTISDIKLWDECKVPLYVTVIEESKTDDETGARLVGHFALASTRTFNTPAEVLSSYALRGRTEECYRQLKLSWNLADFPSPDRALIEAHVSFTLLTFCLFQLFLAENHSGVRPSRMLTALRREHQKLGHSLVFYADDYFGVFGQREYLGLLLNLSEEVRNKLKNRIESMPNLF